MSPLPMSWILAVTLSVLSMFKDGSLGIEECIKMSELELQNSMVSSVIELLVLKHLDTLSISQVSTYDDLTRPCERLELDWADTIDEV